MLLLVCFLICISRISTTVNQARWAQLTPYKFSLQPTENVRTAEKQAFRDYVWALAKHSLQEKLKTSECSSQSAHLAEETLPRSAQVWRLPAREASALGRGLA